MHNRKSFLAAALAMLSTPLAAASDFMLRAPATPPPQSRNRSGKPKARKAKARGRNRFRWFQGRCVPQGERECARRRGGQDWADFKAADRVRRGLPAMKDG